MKPVVPLTKKEEEIKDMRQMVAILQYKMDHAKDVQYNFKQYDEDLQRQIDLLVSKKKTLNRVYREADIILKETPGRIAGLMENINYALEGGKTLSSTNVAAQEKRRIKSKMDQLKAMAAKIKRLEAEINSGK